MFYKFFTVFCLFLASPMAGDCADKRGGGVPEVVTETRELLADGLKREKLDHGKLKSLANTAAELVVQDYSLASKLVSAILVELAERDLKPNGDEDSSFMAVNEIRVPAVAYFYHIVLTAYNDSGENAMPWFRFSAQLNASPGGEHFVPMLSNRDEINEIVNRYWDHLQRANPDARGSRRFVPSTWNILAKEFAGESDLVKKAALVQMLVGTRSGISNVEEVCDWLSQTRFAENNPIFARRHYAMFGVFDFGKLTERDRKHAMAAWEDILSDPNIPSWSKMDLATTLEQRRPALLENKQLRDLMADAFLLYLKEGHSPESALIERLLSDIAEIPDKKGETEWGEVASLTGRKIFGAQSRISEEGKRKFVAPLSSLAFDAGDEDLAAKIAVRDPGMGGDLGMLLKLASAGKTEAVVQLTMQRSVDFALPEEKWSDELRDRMSSLLPLLRDDSERYYVEVILSSLEDAEGGVSESQVARRVRLAKEFVQRAPKGGSARIICLAALLEGRLSRRVNSLLTPVIAREAKGIPATKVFDWDYKQNFPGSLHQNILEAYIWCTFNTGDFSVADSVMTAFLEDGKSNPQSKAVNAMNEVPPI